MSQESSLTQSGHSVRQALTAYNKYQFGPDTLLGVEADIQGSGQRGSHTFFDPFSDGTAVTNYDAKINWFGTVRGRFGYSITPQVLYYATGGLAYGHVEVSGSTQVPASISAFSASKTNIGFTSAVGLKAQFGYRPTGRGN
jgi:outer membrane immunogenic protein